MFVEKLNKEQIVSFIKRAILSQNPNEDVRFYEDRDRYVRHIKVDSHEEMYRQSATYVLIEEIVREKNKVWTGGFSIVVNEDGEVKSAQILRFCLEDFKLSFKSAILYENGDIRKQYAEFMKNIFGDEYKENYNKYLKNNLENEMLK